MDLTLKYREPDADMALVRLPASKSVAARALILSHVYPGSLLLSNMPDCDDTRELSHALNILAEGNPGDAYDLGSGGTSLRFFLAFAASIPGFEGIIDCSEALRRRPLSPLIDALRRAGADIECLGKDGCAPVRVRGGRLDGKGVEVDDRISSQYVSALMMASPLWIHPFDYKPAGGVSRPYVEMTSRMIDYVSNVETAEIYNIEEDWSAASFIYEYALLNPRMSIGLGCLEKRGESLQGDSACEGIFGKIGVDTWRDGDGCVRIKGNGDAIGKLRESVEPVEINLKDTPDLAPALAVGMCMAGIKYRLTGVAHLRHKESDRISTLVEELAKAGFRLEAGSDSLTWHGEYAGRSGCAFSSHGDHRIAMAMAVAAVVLGEVAIEGAEAVSKSFPVFYEEAARLGIMGEICRG